MTLQKQIEKTRERWVRARGRGDEAGTRLYEHIGKKLRELAEKRQNITLDEKIKKAKEIFK